MVHEMDDDRQLIQSFLEEMRRRYAQEIDAVALPDGTMDYVRERIEAGDADTLMFMLKLGWIMGLQAGFSAGRAGDENLPRGPGPIQA